MTKDIIEMYQFNLKEDHSDAMCAYVSKRRPIIDYYIVYTILWCHVFTCTADFTKAFDRVNF